MERNRRRSSEPRLDSDVVRKDFQFASQKAVMVA
jgi:hypothetical protein